MGRLFLDGLMPLLERFGRAADRAVGADGLKPHVRDHIRAEQVQATLRMCPAVTLGALAVSGGFLVLTYGGPAFASIAVWAVVVNAAHLFCLVRSHARGREGWIDDRPDLAAGAMAGMALVLGLLWGTAAHLLPANSAAIGAAATIGLGGMLCIAMMAMTTFPGALMAFSLPLITGYLTGAGRMVGDGPFEVHTLLVVAVTGLMSWIAFQHAKRFIAYRATQSGSHEKQEIISLLLREYEDSTTDWIWGFDREGRIDRVSKGMMIATGLDRESLMGADFVHFLQCITPPGDPLMARIQAEFDGRRAFQSVELQVMAGGGECWWNLTGKPVTDDRGNYVGYIGTGSDVTARKTADERMSHLAHNDPLTGLVNRARFTEQLNSAIGRLDRYGSPFAVLYLDLDKFKSVNDRNGHNVGDMVLVEVARRINALVRDIDVVARLGGDEFAIIMPGEIRTDVLSTLAGRLIESIRRPYVFEEATADIGLSIGIALAPLNGTRADQLLQNADVALYRAKADGRSVCRFFETQMDSEARERRMLEVELRDAIKNGELVLHYQPVVEAETELPTGFEALVRWNHPQRGLIQPAQFIPLAEQSSLIIEIGDWTIEHACLAAVDWPEHLSVAVNLSARHFRLSDISLVVKRALSVSGLAPHRLEIEITETLMMEDPDEAAAKLAEIRALGITIVMDDFGAGYSSLSYLLKFPFDKIKIDRSFISASQEDTVARDILRSIASLGKTLGLKITAEGVETREQAEFLSEIACHQLQGFYFSRPLDPLDMPVYLLTHGRRLEAEPVVRMARRA